MTNTDSGIRPFQIDVPQDRLDDLTDRLARVRWTDELPDVGRDYGVPVTEVRRVAEYWRDQYDWRAWEAKLNAYPQFTTTIDGQNVHFLQVNSPEPEAFPLILTHGWPGSVVEYVRAIEPLTAAGFDLVIPSLPGFGFSGPTAEQGWGTARTARAWAELMRRLGYERYGVVGNDAGSMVSPELGRIAPDRVPGVHVTQIFSFPSGDPSEFDGMSEADLSQLQQLQWFMNTKFSVNQLHSQQPQTLAHALADSPTGLLGWNMQLMAGDAMAQPLDDDFIATNASIYWLTNTAGSSIRFYFEDAKTERVTEPTTVPIGLATFAGDFGGIRRFAERDHKNIVQWHTYDAPAGHYAAYIEPEIISNDIREFFRPLR